MAQFTPVTKTSTNINSDLLIKAQEYRVPVDQVDFDLLKTTTYYKGISDKEWKEFTGDDLLTITTETEIRSALFQIHQEHEIRIRPAELSAIPLNLRFGIAADKTKTKVIAQIDPSSLIPLKKGVQEWIKEAIRRKKLRSGFLINVCEGKLTQEITKMLIQIQKEGPLKKPYRLTIGECYTPSPSINDTVLLHYKKIKRSNNLVDAVEPGDLILEYILPRQGLNGRSCTGELISVPKPVIKYAAYIKFDTKTIRAEKGEKSILYYSTVSGFVRRVQGIFTISQELQITSATFKETGSIEAGSEKDIHVIINQKEHSKDAVGSGVTIDVQKLDVSGTVGSHAKIQATEVTIGAQTHKKSEISVTENATIHLHRGNLKAKEATIEILETGKIEAEIVRVKQMLGGEIIARKVYIDTLLSNATITALERIEIQTIEGDGNNLIIDPNAISSYHDKIDEIKSVIAAKTAYLAEQTNDFISRQTTFKERNARIKQFQKRLMDAKKSGTQPMKADIVRVQQYKEEAEKFKEIAEELNQQDKAIKELRAELAKLYEADLHAVILHHAPYNGHTRIAFIDPKTRQEHALSPNAQATKITLRKVEEKKEIAIEA
ncbi:MAG: FapA family protein [Sulfuricurvum sp.]|jgi:negative regulator of replication initiation|uniref:hypothetical protein n=1 Tax=Sulfuricurvum sp. TaxID=2025608 RepID=UPI0025F366D6|nr:hypothetical protein [Sulfuricurvum sp.]MCK9372484.1 FapA family protein [Sulfuricurvum sp.]